MVVPEFATSILLRGAEEIGVLCLGRKRLALLSVAESRAIIAQVGLGANLPEDAIYPRHFGDEAARPLDGAHKYTIHCDKDGTSPVRAFWSITLYDSDGFQVANSLNRFAVSSWMPFKYNADGSLDSISRMKAPEKKRKRTGSHRQRAPLISPCASTVRSLRRSLVDGTRRPLQKSRDFRT